MAFLETFAGLPLRELTPVVTKVPEGGIDMQLLALILSIVAVLVSVVSLALNIRASRRRERELVSRRHDHTDDE